MGTNTSNNNISSKLSNIGVEVKVDIPVQNYFFLSFALIMPILVVFVLKKYNK